MNRGGARDGKDKWHFRPLILAPLILSLAFFSLAACKTPDKDIPDTPVDQLYNNALDTLNAGNTRDAAKLFDEVERQHPYSEWATQAQLAVSRAPRSTEQPSHSRTSQP